MRLFLPFFLFSLFSFGLAGCTNTDTYSGDTYSGSQIKTGMEVRYGTITNLRTVNIQAPNSGLGGLAGGAIGGIGAEGTTDSRTESRIFGVIGGLIGSIVGNKVEQKVNKVKSSEIQVKLEEGKTIVVVQKESAVPFVMGQRVRVIGDGQSLSVAPANAN